LKPQRALEALNFFVADVQAGIGPFLGVFLQARGWGADQIGTVMTIGGIAGMLATSPAGALVDATRHKRSLVVVAGLMTMLASGLLWISHGYWMVAASQVATAITGAAIGPALAGMTLGMVRQQGFDRQFGRNQVANHGGNVVAAALSGWLGWRDGFGAVFVLSALFGLLSIVAVASIPGDAIDHEIARGAGADANDGASAGGARESVSGLRVLLQSRPRSACSIWAMRPCCRSTDSRSSRPIRASPARSPRRPSSSRNS
jgi:MFS family permease